MKKRDINKQLISALIQHFYNRETLLQSLQQILDLDEQTVSDKMEGTVPFTLEEVNELIHSIPLDPGTLFNTLEDDPSWLKLCYYTYDKLTDNDFKLKYDLLEIYRKATESPNNSFLLACNMLPDILILSYVGLRNLYHLKWMHFQNNDETRYTRFEDVIYSDRFAQFSDDYRETMSGFKHTCFIFGNNIIRDLIEDIHYFQVIGLISDDSVSILKEEIMEMLDHLETTARKGYENDPEKEIVFCISNTSIQNWYTLVTSDHGKVAMFQAFYLNYVYTDEARTVENMESWIHSLIQSSTVISLTGEKERVDYFTGLKEYVEHSL